MSMLPPCVPGGSSNSLSLNVTWHKSSCANMTERLCYFIAFHLNKASNSILVAKYAVLLWAFSSQRVKANPVHPYKTKPEESEGVFFYAIDQLWKLQRRRYMCKCSVIFAGAFFPDNCKQLAAYSLICCHAPETWKLQKNAQHLHTTGQMLVLPWSWDNEKTASDCKVCVLCIP